MIINKRQKNSNVSLLLCMLWSLSSARTRWTEARTWKQKSQFHDVTSVPVFLSTKIIFRWSKLSQFFAAFKIMTHYFLICTAATCYIDANSVPLLSVPKPVENFQQKNVNLRILIQDFCIEWQHWWPHCPDSFCHYTRWLKQLDWVRWYHRCQSCRLRSQASSGETLLPFEE